jgi:uncharacterized protein DUF3810
MNKLKRNKILTFLLFVQIGLVYIFSKFPDFIESVYSNGIYKYISTFFRYLFGWVSLSIGDIIYAILIIFTIRFLFRFIKNKQQQRKYLVFQFLAGFSVFFFSFYFLWGMNYSRQPLTKSLDLKNENYDIEKLKGLTDKLVFKIVNIQSRLTTNDTIAVVIPYSTNEILDKTKFGYQNLKNDFLQFKYEPSSIKKSLFSLPLTYMGFSGYFNPLTGEAQIDYLIPKISLPMVSSHEIAHQLGYASENEANFIGFLAASLHDDLYFQYSAYLMALKYTLFDIFRFDPILHQQYIDQLPIGIVNNMLESRKFWKKYKNPAEPIFKAFYDNFLRLNQQEDGLKSYNKMVNLLISYEFKYPLY